jgi:pimeloyl-ACP methyl ester carboxylesterase
MVLRAALVVLLAGLVAATASAAAPPRVDDCVPAKERASAVRFRAPDGTRLVGVLLGRGRTGIALGHESNGNLCTWLPFARTLAANGYRVLAFDHRGHGESELDPKAFYRLDRDFLGAVAQLRARGSTRFILMGASMGGTAALAASPQVGRSLRAVVDLSAPTAYGTLNALPAVRRLAPPGLFAVGSLDAAFVDDTRELAAASTHPGSRLVIRPTSAHGTALLRSPSFRKLVLDFARSAAA